MDIVPDEFIRLNAEAQEEMIAKTIAAGVIPGQVASDIKKANKINRQIINIMNDMDYMRPPDYGAGYYALDDDKKLDRAQLV